MFNFSSTESTIEQSVIVNIISEMEYYFAKNQQAVNLNCIDFNERDIEIINNYPNLFFKCSPKRVVLTKWIIDETNNFFKHINADVIEINELYLFLREHFNTYSFNKENLQNLFNTRDRLEYIVFIQIMENVLRDYEQYTNKQILNLQELNNQAFRDMTFHDKHSFGNANKRSAILNVAELQNYLLKAREELGEELYVFFLNNKNETKYLLEVLYNCIDVLNEEKNDLELQKAIGTIDNGLLEARIGPLLSFYKTTTIQRENLAKILKDNGIILVKDLKKLNVGSIDRANKLYFHDFINWLREDKIAFLRREFEKIFKCERDISIIKTRASGGTLERAGQENGITRERVRQIESKIIKKFNRFLHIEAYRLLQAYAKTDIFLDEGLIHTKLGEVADLFIYCLKKCNNTKIKWEEKLKGFIIGDASWYDQILQYIETLPDMFEESDLEMHIFNIINMLNTEIDYNVIKELLTSNYNLYGKLYTKRKQKKTDVYCTVLEKFYPNGIKLFDDFEMMRFRNYARELFGDINLPENDRAICTRIADITVLCDRGKYILPESINIDEEVLSQIYRFIVDSPKNVIMFRELFERFKNDLQEKTNISNHFFLQGVLKYKFRNEFFFTKDVLIKDINCEQNIKLLIEEFIKEQGRIVTKNEVKEEFFGISDAVLQMAVANNSNILLWGFGKYFHANQLQINEATKQRLKRFLDDYIADGPVSAKEVYNKIYPLENEFLLSNKIYNHIALYSLFRYLFPDDFEFSHSYVSLKGSKVTTFNTLIKEYLSCFDEIYISDLKDYVQTVRGGSFNLSLFLDDISDEFLRVDESLLLRIDKLNLSEEVIESIEETTLALLGQSGYISVKKIKDYYFYPDIGIKWTPFLLTSIIKYLSKKLKIINSAADYRYINEIIIDSSLNINSYDELLRYALKKEITYGSFKTLGEVKEFLMRDGLISNKIPQSLFDKGWLIEDVFGGITIV